MDAFTNQDGADMVPGTVQVDLVFTAGTSGAVPSFSGSNTNIKKGITSVTKNTTDYSVVFNDKYAAFLNGYGNVIQATPDNTAAFTVKVLSYSASTATAKIQCQKADGTPILPASGDIVSVTFRFTRLAPASVD